MFNHPNVGISFIFPINQTINHPVKLHEYISQNVKPFHGDYQFYGIQLKYTVRNNNYRHSVYSNLIRNCKTI